MSGTRTFRRSLRASAPRFIKPLSLRNEDDCKVLECHVDGYPRPDIRWEKNGKPVGKSRKIHMIRTGDLCLLQIRMVQADDSGQYSCIATNSMGTTSTHLKLNATSQYSIKKVNGSTPQTLCPTRTVGVRSRSMDRSTESVDCSKSQSRSRSASRSSQRDVSSSTKSKLSNLTNGFWKRNDSKNSHNLCVITPKRELSKSTEDCRKTRKNFLTKVKIPDIFVGHKDSVLPYETMKEIKTTSSVNYKNTKRDRSSNVIKANGKTVHESFRGRDTNRNLKNGSIKTELLQKEPLKNSEVKSESLKIGKVRHQSLKNGVASNEPLKCETVKNYSLRNRVQNDNQVPKPEINRQNKPRGKIASYLKLFENLDSGRLRDQQIECGGSLKTAKSEVNVEHGNSDQVESERFFNLGRFMRRKSSGGGKKISEVTDRSTFVSHIPKDPENENETETDAVNMVSGDSCDSLDVNTSTDRDITNDNSIILEEEQMVPVLPDITGYNLNCDSHIEKEISSEVSTKNKLNSHQETAVTSSLEEKKYPNEIICISDAIEEIQLGSTFEFIQAETEDEENKDRMNSDEDSRSIPSILIHEIPESDSEDKEIIEINCKILKEEAGTFDDALESDDNLSGRHCEGKISYATPLIEERCEDLLEAIAQQESLDSDLQRVSTPVESPARIVKGPQSVTVLRGEAVTLAICFTGEPVPEVLWMKGGRVLQCSEEGRLSILEGREMSVVTVNEVTADDSGKYVVCVENEGGGDSRFASVAVVGFPEPPGGEPTASEFTDHSIVLSWYGSMYDGGSVVTGYQVEMCTLPDKKWHKVTSSVNTSCTVQGLSMGQRYVFRVRAENRYGVSHPSKESKLICLNDYLQYDTSSDEEPEDVPESLVTVDSGTHFAERFDLKEEVGKGKFGTVYRCVELSCGRARAAKVIRCLKIKDKEKVRQEIEIMGRLHHPKLMQVLAAFESGRNMIMVMEYISGGELFERVIADDFVLTEHDCILFMKQICDGVAYMHKNDILHLDLKPENILCKTRTSHKIKIIDFGLARVYKPEGDLRILFGTPEFVAPEVLNYEPVSPSSDMWSVGVVCYVLLSGLSPFMGDNDTETFANITRGEMDFDDEAFDDISQDAKDFISGLLVKKIKDRMSAEECLKHPWLATVRLVQKRPLSTEKLKRFIIRRKWQKSGTAIRALGRMVSLSRSSLGSCESYSPLGSPTSSRSRSSLVSRSETAESGDSVFSR